VSEVITPSPAARAFPPNWPFRIGLVALVLYVLYASSILDITWARFVEGFGHGGRFLTVLPRTRSEDRIFREALAGGQVRWRWVHDKYDEEGKLVDRYRVSEPAATSAEGYRLEWYHSTRKAELDALARTRQLERTLKDLAELQQKLTSPRTRYRRRAKVTEAVAAILQAHGTTDWIELQIDEHDRIYVVDSFNRRVQVFHYYGLAQAADGRQQP